MLSREVISIGDPGATTIEPLGSTELIPKNAGGHNTANANPTRHRRRLLGLFCWDNMALGTSLQRGKPIGKAPDPQQHHITTIPPELLYTEGPFAAKRLAETWLPTRFDR
ncbi:MAG TPA: hypothetical protein G4O03_08295 [Dehalococcoidia bacterium]|nr:hypothetical protein [Dehalococcoidia bacterium]